VRSAPVPLHRPDAEEQLRKVRIGYFEDDGLAPVTLQTREAVRNTVKSLRDQGFDVQPFRPEGLEEARKLWWVFFGLTGGLVLGPMLKGHEAELSPILREFNGIVKSDPPITLDRLLNAWMYRDQCRINFLKQMREFPVLLCPVCSMPAFRHGERTWQIDGKEVKYLDSMRYTQWFNLLGNPGVVIPAGESPEGLPIGVQFVGKPYDEELILGIAAHAEKSFGGCKQPPC